MTARTLSQVYLHIQSGRWQWRIELDGVASLRDLFTHETLAEFPVPLVVHALAHLDTGARLTAAHLARQSPPRKALASAPARGALRAVGVPLRPVQEARRAARASRKSRA